MTLSGNLASGSSTCLSVGSSVGNSQTGACWQGDVIDQSQASERSLDLATAIGKLARAMMDHETGRINSCEDSLSIDKHLNSGLFSAEETKADLIETWCDSQDYTLIFVPKEVLWACVDTLDLPGDSIAVCTELTRTPDPTSSTVLLAEHLVELLLGCQGCFQVSPVHFSFDFLVHLLEGLVYIFDIYMGKEQLGNAGSLYLYLLDFMSKRAHTSLMLDFFVIMSLNALTSLICSASNSSNLGRSHFMSTWSTS